ncbi:Cof-type HAD-IIB family hydrolase [Lacticaseibacillus hulanensis]|uniref:Cof-type HAD-IIB family hydrolase n=1 Tax=Lacticaseibacillus hulanensis TaxID=2493111 RepID=UPI000FDAF82E|nr:Cof-type HAD-IIB family hydrolase [Lacticaseibacillus hulanensis]
MQRKLIALDLDGTTLNQAGELSATTIKTLRTAQQKGLVVIITTGRPDAISTPLYDQIGLAGPMINFNGALIHIPHQHWQSEWQAAIDIPTALSLREFRADFGIRLMVAEGKSMLVADRGFAGVPFFPDVPNPVHLLDEEGLTTNPISVTMFVDEETMLPLQQAIAAKHPELTPKTWGAWSGEFSALEVTAGQTSKSRALAYVAGHLGINPADIIAFGDDMNDADMLEFAGRGVAMSNARPEILALADAVTAFDNEHDGMADYLADYLNL